MPAPRFKSMPLIPGLPKIAHKKTGVPGRVKEPEIYTTILEMVKNLSI
jgi:hypothetical protein